MAWEVVTFRVIQAAQKKDYETVAAAMREGLSANCRYAGMHPLHCAVEVPDAEMVAFLMHWGADPENTTDCTGRSALQLAKDLAKKEKKKDGPMAEVVAVLTDEKKRKVVLEGLQARLEEEHKAVRAKRMAALPGHILFLILLVVATIAALHGFVIYMPEKAQEILPYKMLSDLQMLSPFLEHPSQKAYREAVEAVAGQAKDAFDKSEL